MIAHGKDKGDAILEQDDDLTTKIARDTIVNALVS
jgi:hypothetical protein